MQSMTLRPSKIHSCTSGSLKIFDEIFLLPPFDNAVHGSVEDNYIIHHHELQLNVCLEKLILGGVFS